MTETAVFQGCPTSRTYSHHLLRAAPTRGSHRSWRVFTNDCGPPSGPKSEAPADRSTVRRSSLEPGERLSHDLLGLRAGVRTLAGGLDLGEARVDNRVAL